MPAAGADGNAVRAGSERKGTVEPERVLSAVSSIKVQFRRFVLTIESYIIPIRPSSFLDCSSRFSFPALLPSGLSCIPSMRGGLPAPSTPGRARTPPSIELLHVVERTFQELGRRVGGANAGRRIARLRCMSSRVDAPSGVARHGGAASAQNTDAAAKIESVKTCPQRLCIDLEVRWL
jgi:hypothetical protein